MKSIKAHDLGQNTCGIVTFTMDGVAPKALAETLRAQNINVFTSQMTSARLDLKPRQLTSMTRASVHYFNTQAEVEGFVDVVTKA